MSVIKIERRKRQKMGDFFIISLISIGVKEEDKDWIREGIDEWGQ